ncbi:discoidin domain-containing protein [Lysinibacillus xylanilyticus]|uniref:discoidin domain-containing protein n=1 Tax=Lysinibacillus xylanilyticus TaxID=582475 RepID=UPI00381803CC
MAVKEISFKCTKASVYYSIGGVRIYDKNGNIYPIKFPTKNSSTSNTFYIQGTDITGVVSTTNSYGSYYFVDSPFDTDKPIITSYTSNNYWLSSSADTIKISFDKNIVVSRIDFVPYCGNGSDRKQSAVEVTAVDSGRNILLQEKYNTSSYVENQVYSAFTPRLSYYKDMLLNSNNKIYSLVSIDTIYVTNMTSNTAPSPYVASASSEYSGSSGAWKAFDGTTSVWESKTTTNEWIQIDYGKSTKINNVTIQSSTSYPDRFPKSFEILGSNDGVEFHSIATITDEKAWSKEESRLYHFKNRNYKSYRLKILSSFSNSSIMIGEMLFGYDATILYAIPTNSQQNFIKYGYNSLKDMNKTLSNKSYILQDTVSENEQGLWTTKLDRKPLSISFK